MSKQIELKLSVDEVNTILEAMGQMPFIKVFSIIEKIQQQAAKQLNNENTLGVDGKETPAKTK